MHGTLSPGHPLTVHWQSQAKIWSGKPEQDLATLEEMLGTESKSACARHILKGYTLKGSSMHVPAGRI
jgi:hypothetical protein